jgi:hypothetical protein
MKYTILFLILCSLSLQAQDPIFTQFHAVPVRMNPAFAGGAFAPRMALDIYRLL